MRDASCPALSSNCLSRMMNLASYPGISGRILDTLCCPAGDWRRTSAGPSDRANTGACADMMMPTASRTAAIFRRSCFASLGVMFLRSFPQAWQKLCCSFEFWLHFGQDGMLGFCVNN